MRKTFRRESLFRPLISCPAPSNPQALDALAPTGLSRFSLIRGVFSAGGGGAGGGRAVRVLSLFLCLFVFSLCVTLSFGGYGGKGTGHYGLKN